MPEGLILLILVTLGCIILGIVLGAVALAKAGMLSRRLDHVERKLRAAERERQAPAALLAEPSPPLRVVPPPPLPVAVPPAAASIEPELADEEPEPLPPEVFEPRPVRHAPPLPIIATRPSESARKDMEKMLGQRWMVWVGALLILVGLGFFIRQAYENAGPVTKVTSGLVLALALLVAGDRFIRKGWRVFGQALLGTGLGAFYITFYAASSKDVFALVSPEAGFAGMIAVTAAGVTLAILHDAVVIAFIAVLGGFLTPVMISTGENRRDALFAYLLLLDLGVLAVAFFRRWIGLDTLAFAGTALLYSGWYGKFYGTSQMYGTLGWVGAFYAVFLLLPFLYHLRRGEAAPLLRFVQSLANALLAFIAAAVILEHEHMTPLGFVALGLAGTYVAMAMVSRARVAGDVRQPFALLGLAVGFLVLAAPLQLKADGIILAWSVEAPVLLWFGYRYRYPPLRVMALLLLALVAVYGLVERWPEHSALFIPIFNVRFLAAIGPALGAAAFALVHWRETETREVDRILKTVAGCASGFLLILMLHAELGAMTVNLFPDASAVTDYYARGVDVVLWTAGALAFLLAGVKLHSQIARGVGVGVLGISVATSFYLMGALLPEKYPLFVNLRAVSMLLNVAGVFYWAWTCFRLAEADPWRPLWKPLAWAAGALLLIVLSVESYTFCEHAAGDSARSGWMAQMALSLVWGLYALGLLALGFWKRLAPARYVALALFGITAVKVLLFDTSNLREIYRWITVLAVGLLFVAGSYLYYRLEKFLTVTEKEGRK